MADKKVAVIYETDNYDKFKIIDGIGFNKCYLIEVKGLEKV